MSNFSFAQASDPATPATVLAQIAYERADLRAAVAANPSAYPELLTWLETFSDPAVNAAIAARSAAPTAPPAAPVEPGRTNEPFGQQGEPHAQQSQPYGQQNDPYGQQNQPYGQQAGFAQPAGGPEVAYAQQVQGYAGQGASASGQPGQAPINYGYPQQGSGYPLSGEQAPKRRKKGLLIGGIIGAVAVLGVGGAIAADQLIFSKIKPAASPEDATTKMIEALADKDLLSIYGSLSPAEFQHLKVQFDSFNDAAADTDYDEWMDSYGKIIDEFDVSLDGLELRVETIEDGLAKVFITDGKLTVDGDSDEIARLATEMAEDFLSSPLLADLPTTDIDPDEMRAEAKEQLDAELPLTVTASDLTSQDGSEGFVMAVEEDGGWYVSPYLTIAEYIYLESGSTSRGSLPKADVIKEFDSPEAAAKGLTDATLAFAKTGNLDEIVGALPLAERRILALYGESEFEGLGDELDALTVTSQEFGVRSEDDGQAKVTFKDFSFAIADGYQTVDIAFQGTCVGLSAAPMSPVNLCVDEIPFVKEFGLQDLSIVALEEDGSWFVSPTATVLDAWSVLGANSLELYQDGRFEDEQWLAEQMQELELYVQNDPALAELFAGAFGASAYGY